jgi:DNA-binding CsgD family transcriptional regulator
VLVASVSSMRLSLVAASLAGAAFLGGTIVHGGRVIDAGDVGVLAGTVGLIAYTIVGASIADTLGRFVLTLHRLEQEVTSPSSHAPRPVTNLASPAQPSPPTDTTHTSHAPARASRETGPQPPGAQPRHPHDASHASRLTPRQLEAALLACDGLKQSEIAIVLGISPRQVERLLSQARERAGAATTAQLVAMLVTDGLLPRVQPPVGANDDHATG